MPNLIWMHSKEFMRRFMRDANPERVFESIGHSSADVFGILVDGEPYAIDDKLPETGIYRVPGDPESRIVEPSDPGGLERLAGLISSASDAEAAPVLGPDRGDQPGDA